MYKTTLHTSPNTITEIGEGAFYYCTSLTDCILPESVRTIGDYAFAGCSRIAGLSFLPEGTEKIGRWPFYGMKYLFSAKIPSTVKTIGDHAFDNCTRLNVMLSYPTEPPILGENVFRSVPQKDCRLGIPDESLSLYLNTPQWKEFDIRYLSEVDEQQIDDKALKAYFRAKNAHRKFVRTHAPHNPVYNRRTHNISKTRQNDRKRKSYSIVFGRNIYPFCTNRIENTILKLGRDH